MKNERKEKGTMLEHYTKTTNIQNSMYQGNLKNGKKRVVAFCRCSTENEKSLAEQIKIITDFVSKNKNIKLEKICIHNKEKTEKSFDEEYTEIFNDNEIDTVIVPSIRDFGRTNREKQRLIEKSLRRRIEILAIKENSSSYNFDIAMHQELIDFFEKVNRSMRIKSGIQAKARGKGRKNKTA